MLFSSVIGSIPSPSTGTISIGPLNLRMYGLCIALGVIAAVWLLGRQLERRGYGTSDDASAIGMWSVGAGIIGARLYHVVTDWHRFDDNLGSIPKIWEGGLGIPGGLLAGILVGVWIGRRRGIPGGVLLTCAAPAIPLAQAIGRWGNWFNQELFGRVTDLPWALEIDDEHMPIGYASGTTFHPTFLYESLWNLGLCGLLLWIDRKLKLGPGRLLAVYLMGYGAGRFWIEGLRIDAAHEGGGLRLNQWVALAAIIGGALWLLLDRRDWPEVPDEVADEPDEIDAEPAGGEGDPDEPAWSVADPHSPDFPQDSDISEH
ncbi:MAG TPA: prolipoprotein diacylglyceryl transferase [Ilumatobacter sp.]|nr:prolipoprotein diacylglyceryl transferase [Ilumatobacter sp.]